MGRLHISFLWGVFHMSFLWGYCFQGFSWFIDGTVLAVTTGQDGKTVVKMEPWSRPVNNFAYRKLIPSRPVEEISPYRPVPSTKPAPTVPSRLHNLSLPSRPVVKTCPCRPVPPSKPAPIVKSRAQNLSLRPAPPFIAVTPSRQVSVTVKML